MQIGPLSVRSVRDVRNCITIHFLHTPAAPVNGCGYRRRGLSHFCLQAPRINPFIPYQPSCTFVRDD